MDIPNNQFIWIPQEVVNDERLKSGEKLLYGILINFSIETGNCTPTNRELGELLNVGIEATSKYLRKLDELGYVTRCVIKTVNKEVEKRIIFPKEEHVSKLRSLIIEYEEENHDTKH